MGANTFPVTFVFEAAAQVVSWLRQKPVQPAPPPPQTFGVVDPQTPPAAQVAPHWTRPPQPSAMYPQLKPRPAQSATVRGVHAFAPPQKLGMPPPPQMEGEGQIGQFVSPPQPSATGPHSLPVPAHVSGVQAPPPPPVTVPPPQTFA